MLTEVIQPSFKDTALLVILSNTSAPLTGGSCRIFHTNSLQTSHLCQRSTDRHIVRKIQIACPTPPGPSPLQLLILQVSRVKLKFAQEGEALGTRLADTTLALEQCMYMYIPCAQKVHYRQILAHLQLAPAMRCNILVLIM